MLINGVQQRRSKLVNSKDKKKTNQHRKKTYLASKLEDFEPGATRSQVFDALKKVATTTKASAKNSEPR